MALVDTKVAGNLGILVLNNGKYNQLSADVFQQLGEAFDELSGNDAVGVIVLTANPGPVFCAGADVKMISEVAKLGDARKIEEILERLHGLTNRIDASPKPLIAAVNGVCFGGGLELVLACDYIVAAPLAQFALPEVTLGIIPGLGGTQRLPRRIGIKPALKLILSGERISAGQALELGVVDRVIEGDFIAGIKALAADVLAEKIVKRPDAPCGTAMAFPQAELLEYGNGRSEHAASLAVDAVFYGTRTGLRTGLQMEISYFVDAVMHPDAEAGISAFFTKQPAVFQKVVRA